MPNSGKPANTSLLVTEASNSDLWTGGAFGLEGGLLGLAAFALGGVLVWLWLKKLNERPALQLSLSDPPK